jgi:hypothetical protein
MLFDLLNSEVIKQGLISKLQFSLGYKLIASHLKTLQPPKLDFETKEIDTTPLTQAMQAKRKFAEFQDYCATHGYMVSELPEIVASYVNSSNRPVQATNQDIIALRAKISGKSQQDLYEKAEKLNLTLKAKLEEKVHKILSEMQDIHTYIETEDTAMDMDEVILDDWVKLNYEKVLKSQTAYWSRYNNWNDAELVLIEADLQLLG